MHRVMLSLGLLIFTTSALAQICEVDMVDTYSNRIIRTFRAYGDPSTCIDGMKECRKTIRLQYSQNPQYPNNRLDCVRAYAQTPVPTPNPNPYPSPRPEPQPQFGVVINGIIEDQPFQFVARDASELYYNCLTDIRRLSVGSADEIFFTANNNRFVAAQTSGWYSDTQICSLLEQEARRAHRVTYTVQIRVVGSIERSPFQLLAQDRSTLLNECIQNFSAIQPGLADELTYSLNGGTFQRLTTTNWWSSPARSCRAMLLHLDAQIR